MSRSGLTIRTLLVMLVSLALTLPAHAADATYQTGFKRWRAAESGFVGWHLAGVTRTRSGTLVLDPAKAQSGTDPYPAGGYNGHNYYNGGSFLVGEATSPVVTSPFAIREAIASWNAVTPAGTWIETQISAQMGSRWTKWYSLGIWAADTSTVQRHSVNLQGDSDGFVAVDTLVLTNKKASATSIKLKVRLFRASNDNDVPTIRNMSVGYSTTPTKTSSLEPGNPSNWNRLLSVPECSQMVYPDGGEVWCSPTSTSMVLAYWTKDTEPCEPRVRVAVNGVYDWLYDGHGNWPFNTAYAASLGFESYVARFTSFTQVEQWIAAGVPVVISYAWGKGDLTYAPISSSGGHLAVLVGFDASGNPIVNDPAAANDGDVQRTYARTELESLWLEHSGGTVYLIYPQGHPVPQM